MDMFSKLDGSVLPPRQIQLDFLEYVRLNWDKPVISGNLPCGSGKSYLAKSMMDAVPGSVYITANNLLVKQMQDFYPSLNTLIGKKHYMCSKKPEATCEDRWKVRSHKPCGNCAYYKARNRALIDKEPTCYNAISYWFSMRDPNWVRPNLLIIDEADKLLDLLMLISGHKFDRKFNPPKNLEFIHIADWLKEKEELLTRYVEKATGRQAELALLDLDRVQNVRQGVMASPGKYCHMYDDNGDLIVHPIEPPTELIDKLLQCDKLVLMSATLYERDIRQLTSKEYVHKDFESPIDASRRRIIVREGLANMKADTHPAIVAEWIKDRLREHPNKNTIVHVTYAMSKKLKRYFKGAHFNTPEDKEDVLKKFKLEGGLWLASGCAEGIDLPGKQCELNLIPILPCPNIEDPVYKRRLALPSGQVDYDIKVLKTVQQQSGRSTRDPSDSSLTIVGSKRYRSLINTYRHELPATYLEQIGV